MLIVIGRGKSREIYELPGGDFMARAAVNEPKEYKALHENVCHLLRIPGF